MPAELTIHGTQATGYGLSCLEHPTARRDGLTLAHATNALAKHNREHHPDPVLNITALAQALMENLTNPPSSATPLQKAQALASRATAILAMEALTGLDSIHAVALVEDWAHATEPITASIAPF